MRSVASLFATFTTKDLWSQFEILHGCSRLQADSLEQLYYCIGKPPAVPEVLKSFSVPYKNRAPFDRIKVRSANCTTIKRRPIEMTDTNSLAHTKWNCKYHIVFAPKYRRKLFYGEMKAEIAKILRELCEWKQVSIIEAEVCHDHIHMLVEIPPKMSVSSFSKVRAAF